MGQKRRAKELRRRKKLAARTKARPRSTAMPALHELLVPGTFAPRTLVAGCPCGGDMQYVDGTVRDERTQTTFDRQCVWCAKVEQSALGVAPGEMAPECRYPGQPLACERCDTWLTAGPGPGATAGPGPGLGSMLDGYDWYCPSCDFDGGGEAMPRQCPKTRVVDGITERCFFDLMHASPHGEWSVMATPCRSVKKDQNGIPFRCTFDADHEGEHHSQGEYFLDGRTVSYDLRWTSPSVVASRDAHTA